MDITMISNFGEEHVYSDISPPLNTIFQYTDQFSFLNTRYVTGRPTFLKRSLLNCLFLKTYAAIRSLRELVRILQSFDFFYRMGGLTKVPHISTFSHARRRFQKQRFSAF